MKKFLNTLTILSFISILPASSPESIAQSKPIPLRPKSPPSLPVNIPPPPNFSGSSSKNGKFQIVSAEYYTQDSKPFLCKRLVKFDTSTGEAWVLHSVLKNGTETRRWIPLEKK